MAQRAHKRTESVDLSERCDARVAADTACTAAAATVAEPGAALGDRHARALAYAERVMRLRVRADAAGAAAAAGPTPRRVAALTAEISAMQARADARLLELAEQNDAGVIATVCMGASRGGYVAALVLCALHGRDRSLGVLSDRIARWNACTISEELDVALLGYVVGAIEHFLK